MKRLKKIVISLLLTTATISTQFLPVKNIEAKTIQSSSIVKNEQVNSAYVSKLKNLKVSAKSSNFISILDKNKYLEGKKVEYFFTHDINNNGIVYIDKANRLSRIFTNSAEDVKYNLTLNTYNKLSKTCYTYDRIDKKYYWSQGLIYAPNIESEISKSEYDKAIKKYKLARYITKYSNTSSNRSKYLK